MDDQDKELFDQVEQLRQREGGLSEQLDRYRHSREEYEKQVHGGGGTPSVPLERVRRQRAGGRLRGSFDRDH